MIIMMTNENRIEQRKSKREPDYPSNFIASKIVILGLVFIWVNWFCIYRKNFIEKVGIGVPCTKLGVWWVCVASFVKNDLIASFVTFIQVGLSRYTYLYDPIFPSVSWICTTKMDIFDYNAFAIRILKVLTSFVNPITVSLSIFHPSISLCN